MYKPYFCIFIIWFTKWNKTKIYPNFIEIYILKKLALILNIKIATSKTKIVIFKSKITTFENNNAVYYINMLKSE